MIIYDAQAPVKNFFHKPFRPDPILYRTVNNAFADIPSLPTQTRR